MGSPEAHQCILDRDLGTFTARTVPEFDPHLGSTTPDAEDGRDPDYLGGGKLHTRRQRRENVVEHLPPGLLHRVTEFFCGLKNNRALSGCHDMNVERSYRGGQDQPLRVTEI